MNKIISHKSKCSEEMNYCGILAGLALAVGGDEGRLLLNRI